MIGFIEATSEPRDLTYEAWIEKGHQLELRPNDAELKRAPNGAEGGNVSFEGRDLEKDGFSGIAHRGIEIERIYPNAKRSAVREKLFGAEDLGKWESDPAAGVDALISRFARRAFRRPQTADQVAPYRDLALAALKSGDALPDALKAGYRAILLFPRFLTWVEAPGKLDDHAIATRLSYALWVSAPDAKLLKLAAEGKLTQPEVLDAEIDRLLDDPKSSRLIESFTDQWLKLKQIDFTSPDPRQFRTYDPVLPESFLLETRAYVAELIRSNRDITHLVDSGFVFLNSRLARHYDLDLPLKPGAGLQKVWSARRFQIRPWRTGHAGRHPQSHCGRHAHLPVVRGVFVNERILGVHIPLPRPACPRSNRTSAVPSPSGISSQKHRSSESCASRHRDHRSARLRPGKLRSRRRLAHEIR